jgi:hypothetical protein
MEKAMSNNRVWPIVNVLAVVATIVINGLANALPLNNQTTGEISDRFDVFFTPAGYVFSIWGLIYLGLIAFAIFQALPAQRANPRLARIGPWFLAASIANIAWIFLWHYEYFWWTAPVMVALFGSLLAIYLRLDIGRAAVPSRERWTVDHPFSLYLGWVTVATIANITALLYLAGWNGWGVSPQTWTVVMISAAAVIACLLTLTRRDVVFPLVVIWALAGIAIKNATAPVVQGAALFACLIVLGGIIAGVLQRRGDRAQPAAA